MHPEDGQAIEPGRIYVAPPDHHLLVERGQVLLPRGPRENGHRPAVDALFRTAARAYGPRVVGVVLSGTLDDGTAGLLAIKTRGGVAVAQDPGDALFAGMPANAIENVRVDHIAPLAGIAPLLVRLAREKVKDEDVDQSPRDREIEQGAKMAEFDMDAVEGKDRPGKPSAFSCPDCGGVLWEIADDNLLRFRCRVGHAYSPDTLLAEQSNGLEAALWTALRALEEKVSLTRRISTHAQQRNHLTMAQRFEEQLKDAEKHAEIIRRLLLNGKSYPEDQAAGAR